jgi:tetratricopeptide (TPR) repeat protein
MDGLLKSKRLIKIRKDYLIKKLRTVYKMNSIQIIRKLITHNRPSYSITKSIKDLEKSKPKVYPETSAENKKIFTSYDEGDFFVAAANKKYFLEDYDGAIQDYNKAIELNPDNASFYKLRGIANRKLKNNNDAINDYSKAIELNPNDPQTYLFRADALFTLGNNEKCRLDLDKAGELCASYA